MLLLLWTTGEEYGRKAGRPGLPGKGRGEFRGPPLLHRGQSEKRRGDLAVLEYDPDARRSGAQANLDGKGGSGPRASWDVGSGRVCGALADHRPSGRRSGRRLDLLLALRTHAALAPHPRRARLPADKGVTRTALWYRHPVQERLLPQEHQVLPRRYLPSP